MENPLSSLSALQRGQACILCRRRKTKCDGVRPICGPCSRTTHPEHCEYSDASTRSQTEILEERIAQLQNRIYQLEHPEEGTDIEEIGSIVLHDPGVAASASGSIAAISTDRRVPVVPSIIGIQELSAGTSGTSQISILRFFLSRASQIGFVMNSSRFMQHLQLAQENFNRPIPALIGVIHLWSSRLSNPSSIQTHESQYIAEIFAAFSGDLGRLDQSQKRVQVIQVETLLAIYFFSSGRFLEGRYHAAAAMSMTISCQLHKAGSPPSPALSNTGLALPIGTLGLPAPLNGVELGERIRLFWTVFIIDRCWSVGLGSSVVFPEDHSTMTRIDAPWPLNMESYEEDNLPNEPVVRDTLETFFSSPMVQFPSSFSDLEIRAKVSAIFEHATRLSGSFDPNIPGNEEFLEKFNNMRRIIGDFIGILVPLLNSASNKANDQRRSFLISYSLAQLSVIQLHNIFAESDSRSYTTCLNAAFAIVGVLDWLNAGDIEKMDPFIGVIWLATLRILLREVIRRSSLSTSGSLSTHSLAELGFARLMSATEELGQIFSYIPVQLEPVKQSWNSLRISIIP